MSEVHSTNSATPIKPVKPYPEYPLTANGNGQWSKKIRGKVYYFGLWQDPEGALNRYLAQKDDLHAGRKPRQDRDTLTVKDICNQFLNAKQALVDAEELSLRAWDDYKLTCDLLVAHLGKGRVISDLRTDDFAELRKKMGKQYGLHRLNKTIQYVRSVFKFAFDSELIDIAVRFGPEFKRPSKKTMRLHRAEQGPKLFTPKEILSLLAGAGAPMKAMILLGINCGFGNADCGQLPLSAVDLETGYVQFPRPKTGINRRCPLWPETTLAIKEYQANRPTPKNEEDSGLLFITKYGLPWFKETSTNPVSQEFAKLLRSLHINGRNGLGFYTLRHTFRTVADETKDQPACDSITGHESPHMSTVYRETISDERLRAVADHVHDWLFGKQPPG